MVMSTMVKLNVTGYLSTVLLRISKKKTLLFFTAAFASLLSFDSTATTLPVPSFHVGIEAAKDAEDIALTLEIIALITVLSLAPAILVLMT